VNLREKVVQIGRLAFEAEQTLAWQIQVQAVAA